MAFKLAFFVALLGVARAGIIGAGPATVAVAQPTAAVVRTENYDPNPHYSFSYSVADGLTGDNKAQEEHRSGDVVQGRYSLIEPDGSRRIVSYAADPINGFNAIVQKDPSITVNAANVATVATAPVAAVARPALAVGPQLIARSPYLTAAPGALAVRPQAIIGGSVLRPSLVAGSSLAAANLVAANGGLLGYGLGLGLRQGSLYGTQALLAGGYGGYGAGGIVKVH